MKYIVYELQRNGSKGEQALQIQRSLPIWTKSREFVYDGIYGTDTENAVRQFQEEMFLAVDGRVGETTGNALGLWRDVVQGFDASHYQTIDRNALEHDKITFCILKATEGATYQDPKFFKNSILAFQTGLDVGAYHYTSFKNSPFTEFENFYTTCRHTEVPFNFMYLDLEHRSTDLTNNEISDWVLVFMKLVDDFFPKATAGIYTSSNYLREMGLQGFNALSKYSLWAADWDSQPLVVPFESWTTWQYTAQGKLDGVDGYVDLNRRVI